MDNTNSLFKRDCCRLCKSTKLDMIFEMPSCPPVDNYRFLTEDDVNLPRFPMDLYMCSSCGHAQLLDVVPPNILFGNYIYTSSSSPDLSSHFEGYAQRVAEFLGRSTSNDLWALDIGSNDGLFLTKLKAKGFNVLGVDASAHMSSIATARGIKTINAFFGKSTIEQYPELNRKFDIVTANNVFSHMDDIEGFANAVRLILDEEGIFIFEVSYLLDLVQNKVYDYIYHEHLAHHSLRPLRVFFSSIGMRLFDFERIKTKGGSIRCFVCLDGSKRGTSPGIEDQIQVEMQYGLYDSRRFIELADYGKRLKSDVLDLVQGYLKRGIIASYGASATATVLNEYLGISQCFAFIVDDNPTRQGRVSPGHKIPVVPREVLLHQRPVATFISSWRFADLIIDRNQDYLRDGGVFIIPLPDLRILKN